MSIQIYRTSWPRTNRLDRPSDRVRSAMRRLSRDTWLAPDEVARIGTRLSKTASPVAWAVVQKHAYAGECEVVGMIGGLPPAFVWEDHYRDVLRAVQSNIKKGREAVMIAILKTVRTL